MNLNKGVSTPLAILITLILAILVGSFTWWQYGEIQKEGTKLPEIEIPEKKGRQQEESKKESEDESICKYRKGEYKQRVYDSQGRVTGEVDGEIKEEIPNSAYIPETGEVMFYSPSMSSTWTKSYIWEFFCVKEGNYQFTTSFYSGLEREEFKFKAINIPITSGVTHRYQFDWDALIEGKDGATVSIDTNSDGVFEKTVNSDLELTCEEFLSEIEAD